MTAPTDPPDVQLVLRPVADPQVRYGHAERDADYRLKLALKTLLRSYGLRCVTCRDVKAESQAGTGDGDDDDDDDDGP